MARVYTVSSRTTDTFGRVRTRARDHELIVDGPVENGCPGEQITPAELFLGAVASCGTELIQVIARDRRTPIGDVDVTITGTIDPERQARAGVTTFTRIEMRFVLGGVDIDEAEGLVEAFKGR